MSYRSMILAGKRNLVWRNVGKAGKQFGAATKDGSDVAWFGGIVADTAEWKGRRGLLYLPKLKAAPAPKFETYDSSVPESPGKVLGIVQPLEKVQSPATVAGLRSQCKAAGLKGYSKLSKAQLLELLATAAAA